MSDFRTNLQTALTENNIDLDRLTAGDRLRLVVDAASLNTADEIQAAILNPISGLKAAIGLEPKDGAYYQELEQIRQRQKASREKPGAFGYQVLGGGLSAIPTIMAAPFTGGTSVAPTALNVSRGLLQGSRGITQMAGTGAATAGVAGFAEGEGGLRNRLVSGAIDAPLGAVTNVVTEPVARVALNTLPSFIRSIRTRFGERTSNQVQQEVSRIMQKANLTFDEVLERVGKGEVLGDMNNVTRDALKAAYSTGTEGSGIIAEITARRSKELSEDAFKELRTNLTNNINTPEGSVALAVGNDLENLRVLESKRYTEVLSPDGQPVDVSDEMQDAMEAVLINEPSLRSQLIASVARNPNSPSKTLFTFNRKNGIIFSRKPTTDEANRLDSLINSMIAKRVKSNPQMARDIDLGVLKPYRKILDEEIPDIASVRANYANIFDNKRIFDLARNSFQGKSRDEAVREFNKLVADNNAEKIAVFRQGFAQAILDSKGSSRIPLDTLLKKFDADELGDLTTTQRDLLKRFYPEEGLDVVLEKIKRAVQANATYAKIFNKTDTAIATGMRQSIGTGIERVADTLDLASGNAAAPALRIVSRLLGRNPKGLTKEQQTQVASILVTENPQLVQRALLEEGSASGRATEQLQDLVSVIAERIARGTNIAVQQQGLLDPIKDVSNSLLGAR